MANDRNVQLTKSDDNVINTGDHYYQSPPNSILNKTKLYEFCQIFIDSDEFSDGEYTMDLPTPINKKIDYNELKLYKDLFYQCAHTITDVESTLAAIPKRSTIIRKINSIYSHIKIDNEDESSDKICKLIHDEISQIVLNAENNTLYIEDTSFAIHCLMYYAFTKCNILERLPE